MFRKTFNACTKTAGRPVISHYRTPACLVRDTSKTCNSCNSRRNSASAWLYRHPSKTCQKYAKHSIDPRSLRIKCAFSLRSSMHPCPGNWVAIGRAVVYYSLGCPRIACISQSFMCSVSAQSGLHIRESSSKIVVWVFDILDNNSKIKNNFTNYSRESCC